MTGPDEAGARPGFESGTGFLLARLGSLATRSWQAFLAGHGLTQTQYATIMVLAERGPLGQHRLARILAVDARNLVAVLDRLAERDLVVRATDPADRRRRNVRLTGPGAALAQALEAAAAVARDDFLRALSPQQRGQLNLLLESLYEAHARAPG